MGDLNLVTLIVIGINVLISMKGFNDYSFFEKYKFNTGAVRRGEQIRILSSGFLHVSTAHLFFNMFTLYFFAYIVVEKLGNLNFVIVYLGSLILGNLLSYYFHKDHYHYSAVGASGAVSGILYSAILLEPNLRFYFGIPGYIFGVGYLLYSIYGMRANNDNIGHDAHFGGAVGGYVITLLMAPILFQINTLIVGLLAIPIIVLFVLNKTGKI
ncbi:MAG: rhomboid family intramembrane serine protease [Leeuwenhoekiella sp.]|nr:MAG: rhomboid family intramembrane serine protease [Leeuwenhoekiella sp.]